MNKQSRYLFLVVVIAFVLSLIVTSLDFGRGVLVLLTLITAHLIAAKLSEK